MRLLATSLPCLAVLASAAPRIGGQICAHCGRSHKARRKAQGALAQYFMRRGKHISVAARASATMRTARRNAGNGAEKRCRASACVQRAGPRAVEWGERPKAWRWCRDTAWQGCQRHPAWIYTCRPSPHRPFGLSDATTHSRAPTLAVPPGAPAKVISLPTPCSFAKRRRRRGGEASRPAAALGFPIGAEPDGRPSCPPPAPPPPRPAASTPSTASTLFNLGLLRRQHHGGAAAATARATGSGPTITLGYTLFGYTRRRRHAAFKAAGPPAVCGSTWREPCWGPPMGGRSCSAVSIYDGGLVVAVDDATRTPRHVLTLALSQGQSFDTPYSHGAGASMTEIGSDPE